MECRGFSVAVSKEHLIGSQFSGHLEKRGLNRFTTGSNQYI